MKLRSTITALGILMLFFSSFLWNGAKVHSQDNMGIGTLSPDAKSILEIVSTNKGLLIPRMNTAQRNLLLANYPDAVTAGADTARDGMLIYNTECHVFNYYKIFRWVSVDGISIPGGGISGNQYPCQATLDTLSVPYLPGITYTWSVSPAGAFVPFGQGNSSVSVGIGSEDIVVTVTALNSCGDSSSASISLFPQTAAFPPTALTPIITGCTSANAQWSAVVGAQSYLLDVSTDASFGTFFDNDTLSSSFTSWPISGLQAGTTYYYRVRVRNGCGTSTVSNSVSFTVGSLSPAVATSASSVTCNGFMANWGPVSGATSYMLTVSSTGSWGASDTLILLSNTTLAPQTQLSVPGLTSGITYYYRVVAINSCTSSPVSNTITVDLGSPSQPTALTATNIVCSPSFSFQANWGPVAGAFSYRIDVSTDVNFGSFVAPYNGFNVANNNDSTSSVAITNNLQPNTVYYYRVRVFNTCTESQSSNYITVSTFPPTAPVAIPGDGYSCTSITAQWQVVPGATSYILEVSTTPSFTTLLSGYPQTIQGGNSTTASISGLTINNTYYYRVRSDNSCTQSAYSNYISFSTTGPIAPTATAPSSITCTGFNVNWGAVASATSYFVSVSTNSNFSGVVDSVVNSGTVTTLGIGGLTPNVTYYYTIRAFNGCDTSARSNTIVFGTSAPIAPTLTSPTDISCTGFTASWGPVSGASNYILDVSTSSSFLPGTLLTGYDSLDVQNVTSAAVSGLVANVTYYYRVRAYNGCSLSAVSNLVSFGTVAPVAPTATAADGYTCNSAFANWGPVSGAVYYLLDVSTSSSFGSFISQDTVQAPSTTLNITGLLTNTNYYYRLRVFNGCSISNYSNIVSFGTQPPIAPTATPATVGCTQFVANWGSVSGATVYYLDVSTTANFTSYLLNNHSVSTTFYTVGNLTPNVFYYYRVRSGNGCDTSTTYSNTISLGTTPPVAPAATPASNFTCTQFNANWGAVSGATNYILEVATSTSFAPSTMLSNYNGISVQNVTTLLVTGVTTNVTYYYRVTADNGCSLSQPSNIVAIGTSNPIAPTATAASDFTCTSFTANWGAVSGVLNYLVDVATSATFASNTIVFQNFNAQLATSSNFNITPNVIHYYHVRVFNGCDTSQFSNTVVVGTSTPSAPTALPADNVLCTSFSANWSPVQSALDYYLTVATNASFAPGTIVSGYNDLQTGNTTTIPVTGLAPNVIYYYRVRAYNGCSFSQFSNIANAGTTAPIAPTATAASSITCTQFNANWGAVQGALNYLLDVSTSSTFATFVTANSVTYNAQPTSNVTSYQIPGLTVGLTYYYRLRATNGCQTSSYSNPIVVSTSAPIAPTATDGISGCTSFIANWGSVQGATQYLLEVSTDIGFSTFVTANGTTYNSLNNVGNVTTVNVTGLTQGLTYFYRVRADNGCLTSTYSNTITVGTTAPIAPSATSADNFSCTAFNANWGAVSGASQYLLEVSTSSTFANFITTNGITFNASNTLGNLTTYNIGPVSSGGTYFYRVRASNGCLTSSYSNPITVSTSAPIAPTATDGVSGCTSFSANWGSVQGATQYLLEVSTDIGFGTFVTANSITYNASNNVGGVTTYNVTGLTQGLTYFYRIRATNGCLTSNYSNTVTVGTTAPIAPSATPADNFTCTNFNANWGAVSGATQYLLEVSTSSTFTNFITANGITFNASNTVGNVTTYNIGPVSAGGTYFYRVRATNGCLTSSYSNPITVSTSAPIAPTATDGVSGCTSFSANWGSVQGATQYLLEVSTDIGFGTFVTANSITYNASNNVGGVTTYNVTGLTQGLTYFYRIRATNGCLTSNYSNTVTVGTTAPIAPSASPADNFTCTNFNANWGAVSGASQYLLEVSTSSTFATFITANGITFNASNSVGNVTTYNIGPVSAGGTYFYRVRATNGCLTSNYSNPITLSTSAPIAPTATDGVSGCTSFSANWGSVQGATQYLLEVSTSIGFGTFVTANSITYNASNNVGGVTTYNVTGLTQGLTYFYRIRATNGCLTSNYSNTVTVGTTAPIAPSASPADNFSCTAFNANWGAVSGASQYLLEVSTSASFATFITANGITYNASNNVGNVTTYNIGTVSQAGTYFYRVRATNGCLTSNYSNTMTVSTSAPIAPTATDPSNFTCNSFNANWGAVQGATQYLLEVSTTSSFATFVTANSITYNASNNVGGVTTLNVLGLTNGIVYYYRIRATNGCLTSSYSNTITVSTSSPVSPTATPATNFSCTSFNANWGAVSGANQYIIDVSTDASFANFITANSINYNSNNVGNVTTLNITGLTSNATYYYRVKSTNGCDTSLASNTISVGTTSPIAPIAASATNVTCTQFNANWASVIGATQYFIDVSTDANFGTGSFITGYQDQNIGNVTTYLVTGAQIQINTTYYYRVRADNGCSFSASSNTINVTTTSPIAPIALSADNFSCTTFNANWSAAIGSTNYLLDVSSSGAFSPGTLILNGFNVGNTTTYNVIGLTQGTTYYYRIRSVNGCATSGNSNIVVVTISSPIAPNAIDASNITCTSLNANWGVASGATGYYLDVATTANFAPSSFVTPYNNAFVGNTNTYNIIGLQQNITYYYRVRAINGCATSVSSNTVTAATSAPSAPISLNGSNFTCTSFNANWSPVLGAVAYYLDVATDPGFGVGTFVAGYSDLNVGAANTYPITNLAQNANYYYRVRAANICSTSTSSNSTTVTTSAPLAPTSSGSSNLTCTSFNANWGATVGATAYYLDVSTDAGFSTFLTANGTTYNAFNVNNVTTYNITGLTVNNTYYYRVRAGNGCSISLTSNNIMTVTAAPFAPIAVAPSSLNCTSFNTNWGGSVGAITYYLDVSTSATFASFFNNAGAGNENVGNVTTHPISGLQQGVTYYYRVRAASGCTTSPNSNTESATIAAPSAPAALPATNVACTSFNGNWASVSGATSYIIDASTSSQFTTFLTGYNGLNTNGNVTTYNISAPEIVQGGTYYYRVRAVNGCNTSGNSNLVSVTTAQVNAPVSLSASDIACTVFNANWTAVAGVTGYLLDVSTSASFATTFVTSQSTGNVLTYNVTGLSLNTTYYYRVRATSACATSTNSNTISAATTAPAAPNASAATNVTCTSMNINWSAVSGVLGYYIDVSTDGNFGANTFVGSPAYNNFSVGNVTTYNVTNLPGTTVYYRVRSATACTQSVNSNFVQVNPSAISPPAVGLPTGVACTTFNANWSAIGGAFSYEIDVSTSASFATIIPAYTALNVGNVTTYNISGLSVNNTYYYRVRSKNACVTSTNSTTQVVSTNAPAPPTVSVATNVTCTSMNANWTGVPVSGAITYYLDVSTDANFAVPANFILNNQDVGGANVSSYNVTGLTGGTVYYRLRSASACASGTNSSSQMVNPSAIAAPTSNVPSGIACAVFNANWVGVVGALSYEIDVSTSASFATIITAYNDLDVGNVSTFNVTGLSVNNTYYYRVRAKNACVTSPNSATQIASTNAPSAPAIGLTTNITCASFNVNWTHSSGAATYYLDISTDVNFGTYVAGFQNKDVGYATTYNASPLTGTPPFYFRMRAASGCASGGNSVVTMVNPAALPAPVPSAPTGITCSVFNANWQAVTGALSYELDVTTSSGFTGAYVIQALDVGNNLTYNVTGLLSNNTYYYRVRAKNACITSTNSSPTQSASTTAPNAPPVLSANNLTCGSFNARWTAVTGALNYYLDVSTDQTFANYIVGYNNLAVGYTSPTNIAVTGLSQNTIYYYRVRAQNGCTTSGNSSTITVSTSSPTAPTLSAVTSSSCTSFLAQWTAVGGAISYQIDVSANDVNFGTMISGFSNLNVGNVTSVNVTGLSPGILYYFRVRSVNNCGTSGNSGVQTFKVENPNIPNPGLENPGCTTYGVSWPLISSATGYRIDVSDDPSFGAFLGTYNNLSTGNVSSVGLSGLVDPPGEYYFRMRATNACGTSGNSNTLTIITRAPDPPNTNGVQLTNVTCNSFTAIWGASAGATSYTLDVSTSSTFASYIYNGLNVGTVLSYSVPALSAGTFYYRVRGINSCGTPQPSTTVQVILGAPNAPVIAAESSVSTNSFVANWTAPVGGGYVTTYYLDVSTDGSFIPGSFVPGYNNKNVGNVTSTTVSGLPTGYGTLYYRVRASNSCGTSFNSGVEQVP